MDTEDEKRKTVVKDTAMSKAARLQEIVHMLYRNPHGLTTQELARHSGSSRSSQYDPNEDTESYQAPQLRLCPALGSSQ
jgi:hypothetical protein